MLLLQDTLSILDGVGLQSQTTAPGKTYPHIACNVKRSDLLASANCFGERRGIFVVDGFYSVAEEFYPNWLIVDAKRQALVSEKIPLPPAPNLPRHL